MDFSKKELYLIRVPTSLDIKSLDGTSINVHKEGSIKMPNNKSIVYKYNSIDENQNISLLKRINDQHLVMCSKDDVKLKAYLTLREDETDSDLTVSTTLNTLNTRHAIEPIENFIKSSKRGSRKSDKSPSKKKRKTK